MLDPVGAGPARHHQPRRKAVPVRQRLAVHLEGDQRGFSERHVQRQRLHEVRRLLHHRMVGAVEHHFERAGLHAGLGQHILQAHPAPQRIAHRADAPFDAGHMRLEEAAAVARALAHGGHFRGREVAPELIEREAQLALGAVAADRERPVGRLHFGNARQVVAHEEGLVRRDRTAEMLDRRLEVRRAVGLLDQWQLAGQREQVLLGQRAVGQLGKAQRGGAADLGGHGPQGA